MLLTAILTLLALQQGGKAVTLNRVFAANEKYVYDVKSHITLESRAKQLETFLPEDFDMNYTFTAVVQEMKTDGIAVIHYQRPTVTEIQGETYQHQPEATVNKLNLDYLLTVSPINEILQKSEVKPSPVKAASKSLRLNGSTSLVPLTVQDDQSLDEVAQFVHELYRLALFNGPLESSLDFAPKLPFNDVKPGDTWKRTVGYSPQQLQDKSGHSAVQRLDYTYTYRGPIKENGKTYERVTADLNLNTDIAPFANQYMAKGDQNKLAKMPMTLKAAIEFNLDPKTFDTISAQATSQGGFQVYVGSDPNTVYFEARLKGTTSLNLRSLSTVQPK